MTLSEAWETAKEAGYYPVPYWATGDPKRPLGFPMGATGGAHDLQYIPAPTHAQYMGFRLPIGVIALDVDHHDAKLGMANLVAYQVENDLPALPLTYRITSRGQLDAGKMLYRVPPVAFKKNACDDVEIITSHHMFVAGVPGTTHHKTLTAIECYGPDGNLCELPYADDLPWLPTEWHLAIETVPADLSNVDATIPVDDGQDCPHARKWLTGDWQYGQNRMVRHHKADFGGGQVRGIREWNALVYLKTMAIHGHHVGKVIAEVRTEYPGLDETITQRWHAAKGHAKDDADCCKVQPAVTAPATPNTSDPYTLPTTTTTAGLVAKPVKRLKLVRAGASGLKAVEYLWAPYVPAYTLTILGGMEGSGKSQIAIELAAKVAKTSGVLILSPEDSPESVTDPRLIAAGVDIAQGRVFHVRTEIPGDDIALSLDLDELGELVTEAEVKLVIIDPIISVLSNDTDSDAYKDVSKELGRLVTWAEEHRVTVLAVTHLRKTTDGNALNKMMGSRAFTSKPRSVLMTATVPDEDGNEMRVLAHAKCNVGPMGVSRGYEIEGVDVSPITMSTTIPQGSTVISTSRVKYMGELEMWSAQALAAPQPKNTVGRPAKINQCAEFVKQYLDEHGGIALTAKVRAEAMRAGFGADMLGSKELKILGGFVAAMEYGKPNVGYWATVDDNGQHAVPTCGQVEEWRTTPAI